MSIRIAINGYGRIGRQVLRAIYENNLRNEFEVVAVNASGDLATNAHLTQFDTVHGRFNAQVSHDEKSLVINGDVIPFFSTRNPAELPWGELKVDLVLECTGAFTSKEKCQAHITAGAKKVLISAPGGDDVDATIVYGVNHNVLTADMTVVSNASCTTNCLAPVAKALNDGLGNVKDLDNIPRMLIAGNPSLKAFASAVTQIQEADPVRVMHVDLDYVYDPNPVQQAKNIDKLVQRVYDMKISHVFLQAFSDPQGDGTVKSLYFPNRWLPMRADLFNFVSWQLQTRGGVKVYAWMPVLAFDLASDLPRVQRWDPQTGKALLAHQPYVRLSPWDPRVRQQITDIYEDLARHASFSGILFHDDAVLTDFEDVSPEAVAAWRQSGLARDAGPVPQRPQEREAWMRFKSQTLTRFTLQLRQAVQAIRGPQVKTARNLFALPILEPQSEAWFAQNLDDFLAAYDWTVPMAMPLMESVPIDASQAWLTRLVQAVARHPGALKKTIFELQARDWNRRQRNAIPDQQLADWMRLLRLNGVKNYGYYPDDFINNQPDISRIRPQFSSWWYPDHD